MQIIINIPVPRRRAVVGIVLVLVLMIPSIAMAGHLFTDVPNSHPRHADISAVAMAGIDSGCGGAEFCPADPLTRAKGAQWLRRGLGRAASDTGASITVPAATLTTVAETTIKPGTGSAPEGANGFLLINGAVTLYEGSPDNCICSISVRVYLDGVAIPGAQYVFLPENTVFESGSAAITVVAPVEAGTKTVSLRVNEYQGSESLVGYASLSVLNVPFNGQGTQT